MHAPSLLALPTDVVLRKVEVEVVQKVEVVQIKDGDEWKTHEESNPFPFGGEA